MEASIAERFTRVVAVKPQDIGTADVISAYVPMTGNRRVAAHLQTADLTVGLTAFVQLMQAKAGGAEGKVLGSAVTVTAGAGGSNANLIAEAMADELDSANGFVEVGVKVGSGTNGKVGSCVLLLEADYLPAA